MQSVGDGLPQILDRARCHLVQQGFDLSERLYYGIEVRAVGRQKQALGTSRFYRFPNAPNSVR